MLGSRVCANYVAGSRVVLRVSRRLGVSVYAPSVSVGKRKCLRLVGAVFGVGGRQGGKSSSGAGHVVVGEHGASD